MYKINKINLNKFVVIETKTENIVFETNQYQNATSWIRQVKNNNIGFRGWTPTFVLKTFNIAA
jgi:hypothetical protein